ncbi:hypothetical protein GGS20DRAFT_204633 [Poronia punctata]|nr:hypothetical protein GGS20DRAFT_204633 [Poronia punctata]
MPSDFNMFVARIYFYGPYWLVAFLGLSLFAVNYCYCWAELMVFRENQLGYDTISDNSRWWLGLSLFIVSLLLKAWWVGSWLTTLAYTWIWYKEFRPPTPPSRKTIMQVDLRRMVIAPTGDAGLFNEGSIPRPCYRGCRFERNGESRPWLSDRAYHCGVLGQCLPLYDHFCPYIRVAVYLHTLKAYLNMTLFLILDALFTMTVSIVSMATSKHWDSIFIFAITVLVAGPVIMNVAGEGFTERLVMMVFKNEIYSEKGRSNVDGELHYLVFKVREHGPNGGWTVRLHKFRNNPWDLGLRENVRQALGPWWQWPLFWIQPERVTRYGKYAGWDLPFGKHVLQVRDAYLGLSSTTPGPDTPSAILVDGGIRRSIDIRSRRNPRSSNSSVHDSDSIVYRSTDIRSRRNPMSSNSSVPDTDSIV